MLGKDSFGHIPDPKEFFKTIKKEIESDYSEEFSDEDDFEEDENYKSFEYEKTDHPKYYADVCQNADYCDYKNFEIEYGDKKNYQLIRT